MTGVEFPNLLPAYLVAALVLCDRFHKKCGKIPDSLVTSIKNEIALSPVIVSYSFFEIVLNEFPHLSEAFCEDDEGGDDGETVGPLSVELEKLSVKYVETNYHG
jgi:hypothetical protein